MTLALSVPFLTDILSRVAKTDIDSSAPALEEQATLLGELEVGQRITLRLDISSLSPTMLRVSRLVDNGTNLTNEVADQQWLVANHMLKTSDQIEYIIRGPRSTTSAEAISVRGTVLDLTDERGWSVRSASEGAFELLVSLVNGAAPSVATTDDQRIMIGA